MVAFCQENGVPHEICGKLVVAADDVEVERLRALQERGAANGLEGCAGWGAKKCARLSHMWGRRRRAARAAGGIVDYARVCTSLVKRFQDRGARW